MNERAITRFLSKIEVSDTFCWLWQDALTAKGYPRFKDEHARTVRAHRAAYEHWVGEIPSHLQLDHLCRVRHCVNPDHLEAVTGRENILRGDIGFKEPQSHCGHGHRMWRGNLYIEPSGKRRCRACDRRRKREGAQ